MRRLLLLFLLSSSTFLFAQQSIQLSIEFEDAQPHEYMYLGQPQIQASDFRVVKLDLDHIQAELSQIAYRNAGSSGKTGYLNIPTPEGGEILFSALKNETMHPDLAAKYPEVQSFDAYAENGSMAYGKWDVTPHGFHAMIFQPGQSTIFIDPIFAGNDEFYIVYRRENFSTSKVFSCDFQNTESTSNPNPESSFPIYGTCELRTYRLACAATTEYTVFHGGTKALALAAQVTTMNRVNGVYERDIAITMTLIPNNDTLIFTSNPDGYSNGQTFSMINQNQTIVNNLIGAANYDIGHVFGTNSGGLAGLGVVCNNSQKARGVTGSGAPIGDPFDIDYVAHEMGHQFGANHTQNNPCNSVSSASYEPGSASTIMGYAGICSPNVQSNSDDYFHGHSLSEMSNFITSFAHNCPQLTPLSNTAPTIVTTPGNIAIPKSTPFMLTAVATDPDGDSLTYLWEQFDNQVSTQPPSPNSTVGPNFRSIDPDTNGTRYFPNFNAVLNNNTPTWEVLPAVGRNMNFRVSVRDNHSVGSCNDYEEIDVNVVGSAGPFEVLSPNAFGIAWASGGTETVTWDVANTTNAPINCDSVQILLSDDGGQTFTVLLASTPNDGSQVVNVPAVITTQARIMVVSQNGTFYDVSNNDFNIINCIPADQPVLSSDVDMCSNDSVTLSVVSGNLNDSQNWVWHVGSCTGTIVGTGSTVTVSPIINTTYYVQGEGGCPGAGCATVTVSVTPLFNIFVNPQGNTLTAMQNNVNYQWVDCDDNFAPIPGATQQSFTPSQLTGNYACVLELNGCYDTTGCFVVDQTSLMENTIDFEAYPNPVNNVLQISSSVGMDLIEVIDVTGRTVLSKAVKASETELSTADLNSGMYFVRVWKDGVFATRRILKN